MEKISVKADEAERYDNIDGLRSYAAIAIVLLHVFANADYEFEGLFFSSVIPSFADYVFLFMVVSSFSMLCGYFSAFSNNKISIERFYVKRFSKIWPFFAVLVLLDLIISPSIESLYEGFADLTLCFGLLPNAKITVIGVGWTLGVIFVFYLLFPFFCFLMSNKKRAWLSLGIAFLYNLLCEVYFFDSNHMPENFSSRTSFVFCAIFFIVGGMIYIYRDMLKKWVEYCPWIWRFCILALFIGTWFLRSYTVYLLIFFSVVLIYSVSCKKDLILCNPVTSFLSKISMEIYLCHMVIFRIIEKMNFLNFFSSDAVSYVFVSVLTVCGSIGLSYLIKYMLSFVFKVFKNFKENYNVKKT